MKRVEQDDYMQLTRYLNDLGAVPEGLSYDEACEALEVRRPYIARHNATSRVFEESGVNNLLDQMNSLMLEQCVEQLEIEANEATEAEEVFNG